MRPIRGVVVMALVFVCAGRLGAQVHSHDHTSPYAGFLDREIKALSAEEVEGLLAGSGLGLALPGELNGYPGPRHVLDMAPMLALSSDQESAIRAIFEEMEARARTLGEKIIELERELDHQFADESVTEDTLQELASAIAQANAELRVAHLRAHLRLRPLLTEAQLKQYQEARGYGG